MPDLQRFRADDGRPQGSVGTSFWQNQDGLLMVGAEKRMLGARALRAATLDFAAASH
jgi:hypothetical protein